MFGPTHRWPPSQKRCPVTVVAGIFVLAVAWLLAATGDAAAPPGDSRPVAGLAATSARSQAAAIEEIVAAGDRYVSEIETAYGGLKAGENDRRGLYHYAMARLRTEQAKK